MTESEIALLYQYHDINPGLRMWGAFVDEELVKKVLLPVQGYVKIFPKFRIKDDQSFLYKALYRKQLYKNPISEIDDKVGTRVVLLKSTDVKKVSDLIKEHSKWTYKVTKEVDQHIEDQPTIFDYQSVHIIVYPKRKGKKFEPKFNYGCEIQIRTLLQHAFAEISHDSTYKGPYQNDKQIIRHLSKSMALMESTDDYFKIVFELMADQTRYYSAILNELVKIYQQFNPLFMRTALNINLSDKLLELIDKKPISIPALQAYVEKHHTRFKKAILSKNGLIFEQPISILMGYYLLRHNDFIREQWPLDEVILKQVFRAFNYSFGSY